MATEEQVSHADAMATPLHGCGLRFAHLPDWLAHQGPPCLLELHTENLFALPSVAHARLNTLRERHAFSLHGVGLSLGEAARAPQQARVAVVLPLKRKAP